MEAQIEIKVLVVDDSATYRGLWSKALSQASGIVVVGTAANGKDALTAIAQKDVDLILLDLEMPVMDGISAIPLLIKQKPNIQIIIVSSLSRQGSAVAIQALTLGAADYITKPSSLSASTGVKEVSDELIRKIHAIAKTQKILKKYHLAPGPGTSGIQPARNEPPPVSLSLPPVLPSLATQQPISFQMIAIGTSTGGPTALTAVLTSIRSEMQLPILIVQHMPEYFITALAERLTRDAKRPCLVATEGMKVEAGKIYLAPGDSHLTAKFEGLSTVLHLNKDAPENFSRPAVDQLFRSVAKSFQRRLLAIILTGMGEDGKLGCVEIKKLGGTVLAQDEATSTVWGMPGAVTQAGLADFVLPIEEVGRKVNDLVLGFASREHSPPLGGSA